MGEEVTLASIQAAYQRIRSGIVRTPCLHSLALSKATGAEVYLKLETMQRTGSFKDRGALNRLLQLDATQRKHGVIAVSAGNHAQGLAYHATRLGIKSTIVMPSIAPYTKIARTQGFGGKVILHGETLDDSREKMLEVQQAEQSVFVSPYEDARVIDGQGTIALELDEDLETIDCIVVPIGGGGIISGIATAIKALRKDVEVIGVEAALYPSMYRLVRGLPPRAGGDTLAEGIAVKTPGEINVEIVKKLVDDILLVDEAAIESGVVTLLEVGKVLAEGAGAVPLAAMQAYPQRFAGKKVVLLICGANIDTRVLSFVLTREMARKGRMAHIGVLISDRPGVLAQVSKLIGKSGANIVEVSHKRMFAVCAAKEAELEIIAETRGDQHIRDMLAELQANGFTTRRISSVQ